MPSDLLSLSCILEGLLLVVVVVTSVVSRRSSAIRQSLQSAGETTRGARSQWWAILAAIFGANAGYILLIGSHVVAMTSEDPALVDTLYLPGALVAYVMCALPIYLGLGAVVGLLVSRYASRNTLPTTAALVLSVALSAAAGALVAIPIYVVGLITAAI